MNNFNLDDDKKALILTAFTKHETLEEEQIEELTELLDDPDAILYYNYLSEKFGLYIIPAFFCSMAMRNAVAAKSYIGSVEEKAAEGNLDTNRKIAVIVPEGY